MTPTRICGQPTDHGPCENHTTQWFEGYGWRCRFHLPAGESWPHSRRGVDDERKTPIPEPTEPPPNDGRMESIDDALNMIAWATKELSCGRISESKCRGVINGAKSWLQGISGTKARDEMREMRETLQRAGVKIR